MATVKTTKLANKTNHVESGIANMPPHKRQYVECYRVSAAKLSGIIKIHPESSLASGKIVRTVISKKS